MSTERVSNIAGLAENLAAGAIAASMTRRATSRATVEIRYVGADDADSRVVDTATDTESHPYTSFEQGGVRRFDRTPFSRGPFAGGSDLPPFRVS